MHEKHSTNADGDRPRAIPGDIRRLTVHGAATVGELREFLTKMKGKSPQEIIGAIAQSRLFSGLVWSTLIVGAMMLALRKGGAETPKECLERIRDTYDSLAL